MLAQPRELRSALIGYLLADTGTGGLMTLIPDVYYGMAARNKTKFVLVNQLGYEDEDAFDGRGVVQPTYLVKAVVQSTSGADAKAAAERIHTLLHWGRFTATGWGEVSSSILEAVDYVEDDADNPDVRWQHAGAMYTLFASAANAVGSP